jgi:hypothetical protein
MAKPPFRGRRKFIWLGGIIALIIALIAMIIIINLPAPTPDPPAPAKTLEDRVNTADLDGDTDEILDEINALIAATDPDDHDELYRLYAMKSLVEANAERYADAIDTLLIQEEIASEDKLFHVYTNLEFVYSGMGDEYIPIRIEYLKKALALDIPDPDGDRPYYEARLCYLSGEMCQTEQPNE